jgi:hypothetical protein
MFYKKVVRKLMTYLVRIIQYSEDEAVSLWVNHIGPYHNPQVLIFSILILRCITCNKGNISILFIAILQAGTWDSDSKKTIWHRRDIRRQRASK